MGLHQIAPERREVDAGKVESTPLSEIEIDGDVESVLRDIGYPHERFWKSNLLHGRGYPGLENRYFRSGVEALLELDVFFLSHLLALGLVADLSDFDRERQIND